MSRLMQARGLKPEKSGFSLLGAVSRLMQARGLKLIDWLQQHQAVRSRLMQARGLKPVAMLALPKKACRASCRRVD